MRRCKIPPTSCCHRHSAPCCKDCREKGCAARCQNDPRRCGCWEDKPPKRERKRKVSPLQVVGLYSAGRTQAEIAAQLGCCRNTVAAILREAGVGRDA